jgi:hypothetical protein
MARAGRSRRKSKKMSREKKQNVASVPLVTFCLALAILSTKN